MRLNGRAVIFGAIFHAPGLCHAREILCVFCFSEFVDFAFDGLGGHDLCLVAKICA